MTADWTRLPYDLLARISNRITNEVAGVNRVVLDVTSQAAGNDRVGVRPLKRKAFRPSAAASLRASVSDALQRQE